MKYILILLVSCSVMSSEYAEVEKALKNGEEDKALQLVNQLDKDSPDYHKVDYIKASVAFSQNDLDKAEEYLQSAIKKYPHAETYNLAGGIYGMQAGAVSIFSKLGYAKKSKKYLQLAHEAEPTNVGYISGLIQFNIQAPGLAGGDIDAVEPLLKQLEKLDKKQAVQLRSQFLVEEEDEEAAYKYISQEIDSNPEVLDYWFYRAFLSIQMDEASKAFNDFTYIIENKPDNWELDNTWANALYHRGKLSSVEKINLEIGKESYVEYIAMKVIKGTPDKSWATYRLGLIYQHLNQDDLAEKSFNKAMMMNPEKELKSRLEKLI